LKLLTGIGFSFLSCTENEIVLTVAITPDGTKVVSGSFDETLKIWDLATGKELATLTGHTDGVNAVALTADGTKPSPGIQTE